MLISPLMGPIIGIGYGVATNDAELIRTAARNLGLFIVISLLTSVVYFKISPLAQAHSELLARTTPSFWDVLIAFFGGSAGIVAQTRRNASSVIPGVAIATALMPPLCTAGFGLATGNWSFFAGAFFLFAINSVFIALSTALFVRLMKLPQHAHADLDLQRRTKKWIAILLIVMIVPSAWLTYRLVREELFNQAANETLKTISTQTSYFELSHQFMPKKGLIIITIGGGEPPKNLKDTIREEMRLSGFPDVNVEIRYLGTANLANQLNQDLQQQYNAVLSQLENSNQFVKKLASQNQKLKEALPDNESLVKEILAQYPTIKSVAIAFGKEANQEEPRNNTMLINLLVSDRPLSSSDRRRIEIWLKARIKNQRVILLFGKTSDIFESS
jgi:uncharacterized hydrophobic protein (TIGR00271 family)